MHLYENAFKPFVLLMSPWFEARAGFMELGYRKYVFGLFLIVALPISAYCGESEAIRASNDAHFENSIGMRFVRIPSGVSLFRKRRTGPSSYEYGSKKVSEFYLGQYEVTKEQYLHIVGGGLLDRSKKDHPVTNVSWLAAKHFCNLLSIKEGRRYRLPSELEWGWACRANSKDEDPKDIGRYAWWKGNSNNVPHKVGLKEPNSFGLYDMIGNVCEWCSDSYAFDESIYYDFDADIQLRVLRSASPHRIYGRSKSRLLKVFRGGSFYHGRIANKLWFRCGVPMTVRDDAFGFRVVVELNRDNQAS